MSWIRISVIVLLTGSGVLISAQNISGFGYELIMGSLEAMQNSLQTVTAKVDLFEQSQTELKHHVNSLIVSLSKLELQFNHSIESQSKLKQSFDNEISVQVNRLLRSQSKLEEQLIDHKIATVTKIEQLNNAIVGESKCPEFGINETYHLKLPYSKPLEVYCEDGWIVIHRRFNGRLDFNRPWEPYRDGFGDLRGEHWLGLEKMHQITRTDSYDLLVVLKSFAGVVKTAKYGGFRIDSESKQYQLNLGEFVGGDAGDSLMPHSTMKFSTSDRKNDRIDASKAPCAVYLKSGWWFDKCHFTNLNGFYKEGKIMDTMSWNRFNFNHECLKEARMMIRAKMPEN